MTHLGPVVTCELLRTEEIVSVEYATRNNAIEELEPGMTALGRTDDGDFIIGDLHFMPLRLAYAPTVHKTQGLTLPAAQVCLERMWNHNQVYVALSRCRDFGDLRVVGTPAQLERNVRVDKKVLPYL